MTTSTAVLQESSKELVVRQALESHLRPGETLLSYTSGAAQLGNIFRTPFHVGLTQSGFVILPAKPKDARQAYHLSRSVIDRVQYTNSVFSSAGPGMQIQCGGESFTLNVGRNWKKRAEVMIAQYGQTGSVAEGLRGEALIAQINDLRALGLLKAAQTVLDKAGREDPTVKTDPAAIALLQGIRENRLAMQVGAGFFAGYMLLLLFLAFIGSATINPVGFLFALVATFNLWQAKSGWRSAGLVLAILNGLINLVAVGAQAAQNPLWWIDAVMWVSFAVANGVVLTGQSSRLRTLIAVAIYVFGFISPLVLVFGLAFLGLI